MSTELKDAPIEQLLKWDNTNPGDANRFKLIMLHRTIEAMNGLSNRLDKITSQAEKNNQTQSRQQWAMIALTCVLAISTVVYTITTVWSTTASRDQNVNASTGSLHKNAVVYIGLDTNAKPTLCIDGYAYDIPSTGTQQLTRRLDISMHPEPKMGYPVVRCHDLD